MISIQKLTKVYNKGKENEVMAMNALDLDIEAGEFVVIVGSNGSGKSTLMIPFGSQRPILSFERRWFVPLTMPSCASWP